MWTCCNLGFALAFSFKIVSTFANRNSLREFPRPERSDLNRVHCCQAHADATLRSAALLVSRTPQPSICRDPPDFFGVATGLSSTRKTATTPVLSAYLGTCADTAPTTNLSTSPAFGAVLLAIAMHEYALRQVLARNRRLAHLRAFAD